MSGIGMDVAADLTVNGTSSAISGLNQVAAAAERTNKALTSIGMHSARALSSVGAMAQGASASLLAMGASTYTAIAGLAAHKGFSLIHQGVTGINNELEKTQLGFATVFRLFGAADNMQKGLGLAGQLMGQLREDAASLPGEFQDFASMAQTLTNPLLQAGYGLTQIRDLTRQTVVAAANAGVNYGVAAHEMSAALGGRVSAAMPLMRYLGIHHNTKIDTEKGGKAEFSKATSKERYAYISNMLKKADEALPLFERSWEGLTSTITDKWKMVVGNITGPLYGRIKDSLYSLTRPGGAFDSWQGQIDKLTVSIGTDLANGWLRFDGFVRNASSHWGEFKQGVIEVRGQLAAMFHTIEQGFHRVKPLLMTVGSALGSELANPQKLLRHAAMLKVGGMGMSAAGAALPAVIQAGMMKATAAGTQAGVAAAMSSGVGGGALEASMMMNPLFAKTFAGSMGSGTGLLAGPEAGMLGGAGAAGSIVAAGALVAVLAGMVAVMDDVAHSGAALTGAWFEVRDSMASALGAITDQNGILRQSFGALGALVVRIATGELATMATAINTLSGGLEYLNTGWKNLTLALDPWDAAATKASTASDTLAKGLDLLAAAAMLPLTPMSALQKILKVMGIVADDFTVKEEPISYETTAPWMTQHSTGGASIGPEKPKVAAPAHVDARGSKIEIKLDARGETPDRIARKVFDAMGRAVARPLTSPYGPQKGF